MRVFAYNDGGSILFGIDDDGNIKGILDPVQACLDTKVHKIIEMPE
nr:hypothetical protein [uncultured Anaerostipes sp.]